MTVLYTDEFVDESADASGVSFWSLVCNLSLNLLPKVGTVSFILVCVVSPLFSVLPVSNVG